MIGVFCYNVPHRKTYDVLCLLKAKGYQEVRVYASPFYYEKKFRPIYSHRPDVSEYVLEAGTICANFGFEYIEGRMEDFSISTDEILLVCGAGIIPEKVVREHTL